MQNREVPLGSLPIFFSSLRLAEAGRTCPEVRGGETGRGTRATVRGTQKTEPRARARGAGRGCGTRKTRAWGAGRRTQDAGRRTRATGRGQQNTGNGGTKCRRRKTRARGAGRRTRATGRGQQNTGNAGTGRRRRETGHRRRGTSPRAWNATRPHTPRPALQQPAGAVHSRAPSAAGRRYLSRVRIRITPLPPRTPYMLLPRCTSTDLTS